MTKKRELFGLEIKQVKPGAHGGDQTAALAQADAADCRWQLPRSTVTGLRLPAKNSTFRNIDPIECRVALRPQRRFAGRVACIDGALDCDLQACAHVLAPLGLQALKPVMLR